MAFSSLVAIVAPLSSFRSRISAALDLMLPDSTGNCVRRASSFDLALLGQIAKWRDRGCSEALRSRSRVPKPVGGR